MFVYKRDGRKENVSFDKVLRRLEKMSEGITVNYHEIAQKVCSRIFDGVNTDKLDELAAYICSSMIADDPDYDKLASRIVVSNHHKKTNDKFSDTIEELYNNNVNKLISEEVYDVVQHNKEVFDKKIQYDRDYLFDYFGFKTLEKSYLLGIKDKTIERPQDLFMRVSIGIHGNNIDKVIETYNCLSEKYFVHATPTLFNFGTKRQQGSSCFLLHMESDSVDGMYNTLHDCAMISKYAGGIGLHIHNVRSNGSLIRGTNGVSSGIIPMLRVFNNTARHINQAGKRNGSIAIYLEPWHGDIYSFLDMKKNHGNEEERARDLFYALWIPDLFMQRVEENGKWSLMCPDQCKGLSDVYDEHEQKNFTELYTKYESEGKYLKQVNAQDLWFKILESQIETGTPYILYKDSVNRKSNHKNLGIVKSSNLCVAPETKILTSEGYKVISELKDQEVEVFNGDVFSPVIVKQTGQNQKLLTIKTSRGQTLRCTPYHKFYVYENEKNKKEIMVEAQNLKEGMCIIDYRVPKFTGENDEVIVGNSIVSVDDFEEYDDTYCFNEPLKHKGIFNGILTGNCTEIMEYTAPDEIAVCNLASICLPSYLKTNDKNEQYIDYNLMKEKVKIVTRNLNKIIDRNFYPNEKASKSNFRHRPIGIGVQGLADLYIQLGHAFESPEAADINKKVFATIYYGALEASMELAKERSESENVNDLMNEYEKSTLNTFLGAYATYEGSPVSEGKLQYDLWNVTPEDIHDWDYLKGEIDKYGVRNSLLLAPMPTASTAQIMGFTEAFEPITANIYKRRTLAGEFIVVNKNLVKDLKAHNLWDKNMKDKLIVNNGSVQSIEKIPDDIKLKYKTVWEISQKHIINQAADRGAYIDQSQSMNLFMEDATYKKLTNMHFYAWKKGLKTGMYYLRTKAKAKIQQFSIDASKTKSNFQDKEDEECVMCSA